MRSWTLRLPYRTPPLSMNDRGGWQKRNRVTRQVHGDVLILARAARLPKGLTRVQVQLVYTPRDGRRRDTDNLVATLKPCCDALSAGTTRRPGYGLVPDDTPEWMVKPEPVITGPNPKDPHLLLVITELEEP